MSVPITPGTGVSSVAAEVAGGLNYQQIEVYGAGGASVLGISPDGSIKASIIGIPAVTLSGSPSISGGVTVTNTPSVSGAMQIAGASPASIMTVTRLDNQVIGSMLGMVGQIVIHGLTSSGGGGYVDVKVDPSGALVTTASSVVAFQGGTRVTSVSGIVPVTQSGTWNASITGAVNLATPLSSLVSGVTSVITGTASTLVLSAAPSAQRNYVTQLLVTNGAATATFVDVVDNGNVIYSGYAAASGGGFSATFPAQSPLKQPTSVLALYVAPRAQASIIAAASGYTTT